MKSKGFWRWCVIICKSCFLYFVHRLYFNKNTTFRKLDLLPSSGKNGRTETLAEPGGPTASVLSFLFYLKKEKDPASETYFYWNINDGQSLKKPLLQGDLYLRGSRFECQLRGQLSWQIFHGVSVSPVEFWGSRPKTHCFQFIVTNHPNSQHYILYAVKKCR
jgi:hypothetical protein